MIMIVSIIDSEENNKKVAEINVTHHDLKYIAQASEYFDAAWLIAVDAGIVQKASRSKYLFSFNA